jgi:hypothetical protein
MPGARKGLEGLEEDLRRERELIAPRSRVYDRALELLPDILAGPAGRYVAAAWEHRRFFAYYDRPLLLLAALRFDTRAEGPSHPLWDAFAAPEPSVEAVTAEALEEAFDGSRDRVFDALAHRGVQTNETSRAVTWLWPAAIACDSGIDRRIALADIGASAGLNLVADALPGIWTFDDGSPVPMPRRVRPVARLGLDPAPLDATREEDADWLRACVWPEEKDRAERLEDALEAFRRARPRPDAPVLVPVAARNVPARLDTLSAADAGALVLAYQTVMRDYLDPDERDEYEAGMCNWLGAHTPGQALWIELEAGEAVREADAEQAAAIVAHVRAPSGELRSLELARCGFHPTRLVRRRAAEEELRELLAEAPAPAHA